MTSEEGLPSTGEWKLARNRQHPEVVVFVHNYGGNKSSVSRHVRMVSGWGYDCVVFDLANYHPHHLLQRSLYLDFQFDVRLKWQRQLQQILDSTPRPKFIFSLSFPSESVAHVLAERGTSDIRGWICDGGPFLEFSTTIWNFYTHVFPIKSKLLRFSALALSLGLLKGHKYEQHLHASMASLPKGFPVLSIRSWQDKVVPVSAIDAVFKPHQQLDLHVISLPEAGHLLGLRDFPNEYQPRIKKFLDQFSESQPMPPSPDQHSD